MVLTTVNSFVAGYPIVDVKVVNQARALQRGFIATGALGSFVPTLASGYNFDALAMTLPPAVFPFTQARAVEPEDALNPVKTFQQKGLSIWPAGDVYKAVPGNASGEKKPLFYAEPPVTQIDALPTRKVYDRLAFRQYRQTGLSRWQAINPVANPGLPGATNPAVIGSGMAYANLPEVSPPIG